MNTKMFTGILLASIVLVFTALAPPMFGLTEIAQRTLGILLIGLIFWILEVVPLSVTALLVMILQPLFGVNTLGEAFANFANPVIFFVLASFAISFAIIKTPLAQRLIRSLLKKSGNSASKILLVFMIATALLSSIMSNVPVTSLFMGLALGLLAKMRDKQSKADFGKVIMISIPFAGMIGGIMTPVGSSINILTLSLLEEHSGITVSFLEWMVFGIPVTIVLLPVCWLILNRLFKPADLDKSIITDFLMNDEIPRKMDIQEKKLLVIISAVIILWVASSWVPMLNLTLIAVAGMILLFMPGIKILEWEEFSCDVSWNAIIMMGGVISIGQAAIKAELGDWLVNLFIHRLVTLDLFMLLVVIGLFVALLKLPIPIAPAIITILVAPLYSLALLININPVILFIPLAFLGGACLLVPLDAVPLITYSQGYYSIRDMFVSGSLTTIVWVLVTAAWIPVVARIFGLL
ncbi:MAG: DASS family sodium-coupled anion symporter [Bacillota bacterium]|nr:DASS family sodium-coupled anion symporter [Bacillota bacterium]